MDKMIMRYVNLTNKRDIAIRVTYKDREINFNMKPLLTRVSKDVLGDDKQFKLLVEYWTHTNNLDYIMDLYITIEDIIMNDLTGRPSEAYKALLYKILDTIDYGVMVEFITEHKDVSAPAELREVFDELIITDAMGTRVKTYLKNEYYELIALVLASKAVVGPLCELASINKLSVISTQVAFSLMRYIEEHPIFDTPPAIKLKGFVDSNTYSKKNEEGLSVLSFRKKVSVDELGSLVFSQIFLKTFCSVIPEYDTDAKHTINLCYSALNNILNKANNIRDNVTIKSLRKDEDDKESVFETYRESTDLMLGQIVEFEFVLSNPQRVLSTMIQIEGMEDILTEVLGFLKPLRGSEINKSVKDITSWVMHNIIDSRSLMYVEKDYLVNAIAISYTYLWLKGHRDIARMLTIYKLKDEGFSISFTANKIGLRKEIVERLNKVFDVKEELHSKSNIEEKNSVGLAIEKIVKFMFIGNYKYLCSTKHLEGLPRNVEINSDIRNLLAEVIIDINT